MPNSPPLKVGYREQLTAQVRREVYARIGIDLNDLEWFEAFTQCPGELARIVDAAEEIVNRTVETAINNKKVGYYGS